MGEFMRTEEEIERKIIYVEEIYEDMPNDYQKGIFKCFALGA